jgi:ATP-dependent 26S proteasome regulatory subunit
MSELSVERQRLANVWEAFARKFEPIQKTVRFVVQPQLGFSRIGGLESAKEEMLTYACAATDPEVYGRWGTFPPSALLLVGAPGSGKTLLAEAFASHTGTPFVDLSVPRLVLQVLRQPKVIGEMFDQWSRTLADMSATTVYFDELEFTQAEALGALRPDLPIGPVMDFLLELVDRAIADDDTLVLGSTGNPDALRSPFLAPGRFERVVAVSVVVPDDVVAALEIHAADAEKRAGRPLFQEMDWSGVVRKHTEGSIAEWVRLLHATLRRKARCEAASEPTDAVTTADLVAEVEQFQRATKRLPRAAGRYL